ncbi:MAG: UbiD family decarboxylase, partial [Rhodospirillaceae bacterium]|nr:UbiD family decarboxylase [Rhodospirillaceae bacterium]
MSDIDTEKFRLRKFIEKLDEMGEVTTVDTPVELTNLAAEIEANEKAVLFKQVGPEKLELVANVNGSRARLAAALDVE